MTTLVIFELCFKTDTWNVIKMKNNKITKKLYFNLFICLYQAL